MYAPLIKDRRYRSSVDDRSAPQLWGIPGYLPDSELPNITQSNYRLYREMRYDPTIAFARMLVTAPLIIAGWAYNEKENAPTGAMENLRAMLEPLRVKFIKHAIEGYIDYGWSPFEVTFKVDPRTLCHNIFKFKALTQDQTEILVDVEDGSYIGLRQYNPQFACGFLDLSVNETLLCTFDVEGTYWYGTALMENAKDPFCSWNTVEQAANRYDKKIAGSHWVVHFPVGRSRYNGEEMDNDAIANAILGTLEASGKIAIPNSVSQFLDDATPTSGEAWKIELISDKGTTSASFTTRQKYLDSLKVRAFGIPERAILEGQFGTKAESEAQADFAEVTVESRHLLITSDLNRQIVNRWLLMNYGPDSIGTVNVSPVPLGEEKKAYIRSLYDRMITNNDVMLEELESIDFNAIRDELRIPSVNKPL